jgi:hypothetical protein
MRRATGETVTVWKQDGYELRLFDGGTDSEGRDLLAYSFTDRRFPDGRRLFTGADYRPSPLHAVDSLESIAGLLGFLSLREGDTDGEYFDTYNERQLAWRDSGRAEELQLIVHELEGNDG